MKKEEKQIFINRITNGNSTEIIAVLFDMIDCDFQLAYDTHGVNDGEYLEALRHAQMVLCHLQNALDFKYEISSNLYSLYDFAKRQISTAMYKNNKAEIDIAKKIIDPIADAFRQIAKADDSAPVMENTQQVTAGLTYRKGDLTETVDTTSRGFFA